MRPPDVGFKVFALDTSNVVPWNPNPAALDLTMRDARTNLLAGRTEEDLLWEVLLKKNVPLDAPLERVEVETEEADGRAVKVGVWVADGGALYICLENHIPAEAATAMLKLRDERAAGRPVQFVFREEGFTDLTKTNALSILEQGGVDGRQVWTL